MLTQLLLVLAVTSVLAWWLSGYDHRLTGEHKPVDFTRRAVRCVITLLLVGVGSSALLGGGRAGGFVFLAIVIPLGIVWAGCLSEFFTRCFQFLIDSPDNRPVDLSQTALDLDTVARQVQGGRYEEAIAACATLLKTGDASSLAMETMLDRLYASMLEDDRLAAAPPSLRDTWELYRQGRCAEAASALKLLVNREPRNLQAMLLLIRIYTRDLASADKACALVDRMELRHEAPPGFGAFVRRSVEEWSGTRPRAAQEAEGIESLLARRDRADQRL